MPSAEPQFDTLNRTWTNISSESERRYIYYAGDEIVINQPQLLHVSPDGAHRVSSEHGICHYIPPGWIAIKWFVKPGQPHFVK